MSDLSQSTLRVALGRIGKIVTKIFSGESYSIVSVHTYGVLFGKCHSYCCEGFHPYMWPSYILHVLEIEEQILVERGLRFQFPFGFLSDETKRRRNLGCDMRCLSL